MNQFESEEVPIQDDSQFYNYPSNFGQQEAEFEYQPSSKFKTQKNSTRSITKEIASLFLKSVRSKRISKHRDHPKRGPGIQREAQYTSIMSDYVQVEVGNLENTNH
ncbi:unnamed protein product [Paramecium octaurelia]|uniref:Uncharacterized protein n=1 Tax=Paramecium octaurelia TaxID=43137 RepID=A0A8S1ULJ6_PAROT|nr:unnamed protein product [Paramecium octaurelia]